VGSALGRKFLGYELWVAKGREVNCAVAHKALDDFKNSDGLLKTVLTSAYFDRSGLPSLS